MTHTTPTFDTYLLAYRTAVLATESAYRELRDALHEGFHVGQVTARAQYDAATRAEQSAANALSNFVTR